MSILLAFILLIILAIIAFVVYVIKNKKTNLMMPICKIPIIGNLICTCPNGYSRTIYDWGTPNAPCNNGCVGRYKPNSVVNGKKIGSEGGFLDSDYNNYPNQCWACPNGTTRTWDPITASTACASGWLQGQTHAIKLPTLDVTYNPYIA